MCEIRIIITIPWIYKK